MGAVVHDGTCLDQCILNLTTIDIYDYICSKKLVTNVLENTTGEVLSHLAARFNLDVKLYDFRTR